MRSEWGNTKFSRRSTRRSWGRIRATMPVTPTTLSNRSPGTTPWSIVGASRQPTEAEWEYACRAGTTNAFGLGLALRSGMANFDAYFEYDEAVGTIENPSGVFLDRTTSVGSYAANAWGLYDM